MQRVDWQKCEETGGDGGKLQYNERGRGLTEGQDRETERDGMAAQ